MDTLHKMNRIPMDKIQNFRSLGGYAAGKERTDVTRHDVFYRSARIHTLSDADKERFSDLNIKTVIDLREPDEAAKHPDFCIGDPTINHYIIDIMADMDPKKIETWMKKHNITLEDGTAKLMGHFYASLVDTRKEDVAKVFHVIAKNIDHGAILFHCTVGRDRTGVIAALILLLCEVEELDVIANYQVSETYLSTWEDTKVDLGTPASNMVQFLKHLSDTYGGAVAYLKQIGVSEDELHHIRKVFLAK